MALDIRGWFDKLRPRRQRAPSCDNGHPLLVGQRPQDCFDCYLLERYAEERAAHPPAPKGKIPIGVFICLRGTLAGKAFTVDLADGGTYTVGAAPDCDLTLPDESVSRRHATITRHLNKLIVRDEDSATHSAIRGEQHPRWRVLEPDKDYWFHDGYVFRIGDVELLFRAADVPWLASSEPPRLQAANGEG